MSTPLPKDNRCGKCGEWFHNAHVCPMTQDKAHPTPAVAEAVMEQARKMMGAIGTAPSGRVELWPVQYRNALAEWFAKGYFAALATPPSMPAAQAVEEAEGARQVVEVYDKLHEGKVGQHWLWAVIEQIAAGVPEDEVLKSFGYYEKQEPCFHRPACEECAEDRALAGGAAK